MADDDDIEEGEKKSRGVPNFDPQRVYYCARVYREMARHTMRHRAYDVAKNKLDWAVSFSKKPEDLFNSLYLRSKCSENMIEIPNAMADCEQALSIKNQPRINYLLGHLFYKQNQFGHALSTFAQHLRPKAYPDQFDYGVDMVTGTLQNCVGKNAGPLGKFVLGVKLKTTNKTLTNEEIKMQNDAMESKRKAVSEKYLGSLADDKRMITEIFSSPPMLGENETMDLVTRQVEKATVEKLGILEDCLRQRKPLYYYDHQKITPSTQRKNEMRVIKRLKIKLLTREMDRQIRKMEKLYKQRDFIELYKVSEFLRKKICSTPRSNLLCRTEYLTKVIDIAGRMYLKMKTPKKLWNSNLNDKRILAMIGFEQSGTTFRDLCKESFHVPVIDVRAKIEEYTEYFLLTEDEYQKMYYNFEIACLYSMIGRWREARSFSKTSIFDSRKQSNVIWYINALFVYARSEVQDGRIFDSMVTFLAIRETCRRFGYTQQEEFFSRTLTLLHNEPMTKKVLTVHKSASIREQQIINLMPDFGLKIRAKSLFNRMNNMPPWRRMMLTKGSAIPIAEKVEGLNIIKEALIERELMKEERAAVKKARAQAAAASEKSKESTTIVDIENVDNYTMRKLVDCYRRSPFNLDNFQT